jgi:hypothetical protein
MITSFFLREEVDKIHLRAYLFLTFFCLRVLELFDNLSQTRQKIISLMDPEKSRCCLDS